MINLKRRNKRVRWVRGVTGLILISALAGCNRDEAKVYHVPKEGSPPSQPASAAATPAPEMATPDTASTPASSPPTGMAPPMSLPQLKYHVPEGWKEKPPSEMRVASFAALGPKGQSADVSAIPMPIVGRDLELVNMWRSQVQLPSISDPDAVKKAEPVAIGGDQGRLFTFVSDKPIIGKSRQRMLVAMCTRGDMSWFFKMSGEDEFVASQKGKFIQLLKSVSFEEGAPAPEPMAQAPMAPAQMPSAPAPAGENVPVPSIWTIPSGWQSIPPSQFLLAEFSVPDAGGAKAEVNVAEMGGTGGGVLPNVNRWRGQLGLEAIGESDLPQLAKPLDVPGGNATLVDFEGVNAKTGLPTRLVAVIVSQNDRTWFYKLMGDKQVVAKQKDAFTKFIRSANYANAR